jgi:glycosyltransferase involved in cell wall biosynthesis
MRILMIAPSFHPSVGGVETHVRRVADCLSARDHQVTVLTHADAPSSEHLGRLHVHRLPRTGWLAAWRSARPHIAAADIVHCHDAYSFLHFFLPSCWLPPRRPVFVTFHGYEAYPIPAEAVRRRQFVRRRVRNALCMGDFICRWYGASCFAVSYGGVDAPESVPSPPSQPSALFVGRLAEDTSIMLYLQALSELKREYGRQLPLVVVGDGPLRTPAERYAEAQGLGVRFLGTVADLAPLLADAHFAFVSGYLAIWQALSYRRLVFAVCENELKRDYLLGFPEAKRTMVITSDPAELAAELDRHLREPAARDPMLALGARLAAEHSWDGVADLYLAMYRAHSVA